VKNFRDARSVIAEATTNLMAHDPEAVAWDAMTVNPARPGVLVAMQPVCASSALKEQWA
jgi:hypothetical protein